MWLFSRMNYLLCAWSILKSQWHHVHIFNQVSLNNRIFSLVAMSLLSFGSLWLNTTLSFCGHVALDCKLTFQNLLIWTLSIFLSGICFQKMRETYRDRKGLNREFGAGEVIQWVPLLSLEVWIPSLHLQSGRGKHLPTSWPLTSLCVA